MMAEEEMRISEEMIMKAEKDEREHLKAEEEAHIAEELRLKSEEEEEDQQQLRN